MTPSPTQFATLTGTGRSAIAVVAIMGPDADDIVTRCFQAATRKNFSANQVRFGSWTGPDSQTNTGESVVVTPRDDRCFEIHCHGGPAAVTRILNDLADCGATPATSSHVLGREMGDRLIYEAEETLSRCTTTRLAALVMPQVRGAFRDWARSWLAAVEPGSVESGPVVSGNGNLHLQRLQEAQRMLQFLPFARRLTESFRVVVVGPPNVGKSSLLNALVGYDRSITLDVAGTTRDVLHAETVLDGLPIRLSDTAGIHSSDEPIERQGMAKAQQAAERADLLLIVSEPQSGSKPTGEIAIPPAIATTRDAIHVLNKSDKIVRGPSQRQDSSRYQDSGRYDVATNALTGDGVDNLMAAITDRLSDCFPRAIGPLPVNKRQADWVERIAATSGRADVSELLQRLIGIGDAQ